MVALLPFCVLEFFLFFFNFGPLSHLLRVAVSTHQLSLLFSFFEPARLPLIPIASIGASAYHCYFFTSMYVVSGNFWPLCLISTGVVPFKSSNYVSQWGEQHVCSSSFDYACCVDLHCVGVGIDWNGTCRSQVSSNFVRKHLCRTAFQASHSQPYPSTHGAFLSPTLSALLWDDCLATDIIQYWANTISWLRNYMLHLADWMQCWLLVQVGCMCVFVCGGIFFFVWAVVWYMVSTVAGQLEPWRQTTGIDELFDLLTCTQKPPHCHQATCLVIVWSDSTYTCTWYMVWFAILCQK